MILSLFASVLVTWKYTSTAVATSCRFVYAGSAMLNGSTTARLSLRQFRASAGGVIKESIATEAAAARLNILSKLTRLAEFKTKDCSRSVDDRVK